MIHGAAEQAGHVGITVQDGCVTLTGRVASLRERRLAIDAGWPAPGMHEFVGQLSVT
nr:BON domain-containing protein [Burkholderia diffusa]